jgi:hypothetical protein
MPQAATAERETATTPVPTTGLDDERGQFLPVRTLRQQYLDYLMTKVDEISEQQEARHYYHGAQWTPEQMRILRERRQPPSTWNRTARKINGIVGLVERMRSDPKAFANTPRSEQGAEIATHSIRYVLDANEFKNIDPWCLLQCAIDGVAGVQARLVPGKDGNYDIELPWVIGDEYFYDPMSYRLDFADNRYEGIGKWCHIDDAVELFPDKEDLLRGLISSGSDLTTNSDREYKWIIIASKQVRLIEHWYKHRGNWCWAFYISDVLLDEGLSPFYDEKNKRCSAFRMFAAAVDHDGDRYGFCRNLKSPQDALNQGKAKTLHIAGSRRLIADKGAVDDVETARREWARPDGFIEKNPGKQIVPDATAQDLQAFLGFTEDAKNELEQYANTNVAALTGGGAGVGTGIGNLSGRAIELLRQPGMAELGPFILSYRSWKLRLFRFVWSTAQRYWTKEKWIAVTDDEKLAHFIQLNGLGFDQFGRPALINAIAQLDVKITIDEGQDVASIMQDAYETLKGYPPGTFPPQVLIELNPNIPRSQKDRILQMMAPKPQQQPPEAEIAKRLALEGAAAQVALTGAKVRDTHAAAEGKLAKAEKDRAGVGTEAARAGHLAAASHLDAAEFARDTLQEAMRVDRELQQPKTPTAPQP